MPSQLPDDEGPSNGKQDDQAMILALFKKHVPAVAEGAIEIVAIANERGLGTMVAFRSTRPSSSPVSLMSGYRGEVIKAMMKELRKANLGQLITIVWSDRPEEVIQRGLSLSQFGVISEVSIRAEDHSATVRVSRGRKEALLEQDGGLLLRLTSKLVCLQINLVAVN